MSKEIIVDGNGHVAGKLASVVAKRLLEGYKISIVSVENIAFTGPIHRRIGKYTDYKRKRCVVNPARGAFHYKEPSKYFTKIVRGMIPRKTKRGSNALNNLSCYEGIPREFENLERMVFPRALLENVTDRDRPSCTLGQVLSQFGWSHADLANKLTESLKKREESNLNLKKQQEAKVNELTAQESFKREVQKRLSEFA